MSAETEKIKQSILSSIREYYKQKKDQEFVKGQTRVQYSGAVLDENETIAVAETMLKGWLGLGEKGLQLEKSLKEIIGGKACFLTNSGSSANLLAISAIKQTGKSKTEVIVPACSFPTTVNPIIQNSLTPVFIDCELGTYNPTPKMIEEALTEKTAAIALTHTLGNPCEIDKIAEIAKENNLLLLEDTCDALGSKYNNKPCGSFGDLSTYSFYPAHHMTMGEGGAVVINNPELIRIVQSLRSWGRDCWCNPGVSNTCGKRFEWQLGDLPYGYDHKYIFTTIGYNMKPTELQAAIGLEQIKKLPSFESARKNNFTILYKTFKKYEDIFILPKSLPQADPSWFSFPITIRDGSLKREQITGFLEESKIETRTVFSGNIVRQPAYKNADYKISGSLINSDKIMKDTFFLGVYPGITENMMDYMVSKIEEFMGRNL